MKNTLEYIPHCFEYDEWMEQNRGYLKTTKKGKPRHFLISDCLDNKNGCRGCGEDITCDYCGIRLCLYLAKEVDDELFCPACWVVVTECAKDDRSKENY